MTSYQGNGNNNNQYHPNPNISIIMATSKGPSIPPSVPHQPLAAPTVNPTASIAQTGMAYPQTTSKPSAHAAYPQIQIQQQTQQQQQQYLQYQQLLQQQQQQQYLPPQFKTQPQVKGAPAGYASQTIPQQVPELEWFRNLTGVTEEEFRAKGVYNFITTNPERSDELLLRNSVTGTLYECGSFRLTNESELRRRISTLSISQAPCGPCEFIIVTAESGVQFTYSHTYTHTRTHMLLCHLKINCFCCCFC